MINLNTCIPRLTPVLLAGACQQVLTSYASQTVVLQLGWGSSIVSIIRQPHLQAKLPLHTAAAVCCPVAASTP